MPHRFNGYEIQTTFAGAADELRTRLENEMLPAFRVAPGSALTTANINDCCRIVESTLRSAQRT
jgi:hypothetical protein